MSLTSSKRAIGECWDKRASGSGHYEILIRLDRAESEDVAAILCHELAHAAVGLPAGHGKAFKKCVRALGLDGKPTATVSGERFREIFAPILAELGPIPHAPLRFAGLPSSGPKKQGTRLLKTCCPECGYTVRVTQKWLSIGAPICPADRIEMETK